MAVVPPGERRAQGLIGGRIVRRVWGFRGHHPGVWGLNIAVHGGGTWWHWRTPEASAGLRMAVVPGGTGALLRLQLG